MKVKVKIKVKGLNFEFNDSDQNNGKNTTTIEYTTIELHQKEDIMSMGFKSSSNINN